MDLNKNIKPILALVIIVLSFGYFFMCSIRDLKPDPQILIAFVSSIGVCIGYYFGSSSTTNKPDTTTPVNGNNTTVINSTDTSK